MNVEVIGLQRVREERMTDLSPEPQGSQQAKVTEKEQPER